MANLKDLIVNGASRFIGKTYINDSSIGVINGTTVGNNPKFTDTTALGSMTGVLSTVNGGTGSSTLAGARSNLGLGSASTYNASTSISASSSAALPTGAAVTSYVSGLGYGKGTVGGNGTSGYLTKWTGTTAIGNGPQFGGTTATTKFLTQAGTWLVPPNTTYSNATTAVAGLMSAADKIALNGAATSAFKTIKVGTTNLVADSKDDTLTITAGDNITLTPTASSDSFTIAATNTTYSVATTAANGLMSAADKATLDGLISTGGEVNQNAFSNVVVGNSTVAADQKTDTLTLVGSGSISLTADTTNDKITISGTNTTYAAATTAANGLMSKQDKIKVNGIESSFVKKSGDTMSGNLTISGVDGDYKLQLINSAIAGSFKTDGDLIGLRDDTRSEWIIHKNSSGRTTIDKDLKIAGTTAADAAIFVVAQSTNVAKVQASGDKGMVSLFMNNDSGIGGLYDYTNAKRIIAKDIVNGTALGAATTFYGEATSAQTLTSTLPISKGGTGATTRLNAAKALTDEAVTSPNYFVGLTSSWGKFGYTSIANAKSALSVPTITAGNTAGSSKSLANNSATQIQNMAFTPGTYIIVYGCSFASNSSGYRQMQINTSTNNSFTWSRYGAAQAAANGFSTVLQRSSIVTVSSNTTYRIWAKQNSGSALTVYPYISYIKIA